MLEKKIRFLDVGNTKAKIKGTYIGQKDLYLEGRLKELEGEQLKIGLAGPWPEDIRKTSYDAENKIFKIFIAYSEEIRISLLKETLLYVPMDTKKIRIYGIEV